MKNRLTASAPRRTMRDAVASGHANRAGRLAALESACVCDRCGQERASRCGREGNRQIQAAQNRRKKTLASAAGFCKSRILRSLLLQFQFLEGPLRRVFFFRSSGFLQVIRSWTGQNRNGPHRVCLNSCRTASTIQRLSVMPYLYSLGVEGVQAYRRPPDGGPDRADRLARNRCCVQAGVP
jgi:hypothetical protein